MEVNESRGTPSIIKEIFNDIKIELDDILKSNISNSISIDIDKNLLINNKQLNLKSSLKILFVFKNTTQYNGNINFLTCFDPDELSTNLINDYSSNNVIRMLNIFNKINNINFILKKESDIIKYFKGWKKYLNRVSEKMYSKIEKKIIEISNKNPNNDEIYETYEDKNILSYDEHRKKNLREKNLSELLSFNINDFI